ncbi:MAG: hypothetical protein R3234_10195, partial [Thermoanaerobaculia bacterium]|nr:hypothetical protein [Thermoanaerobaculia bacterium]
MTHEQDGSPWNPSAEIEITTGPLPGSRKVYLEGSRHPELRVPCREVELDGGSGSLRLYDSSGPYTDSGTSIDVREGLRPLREEWIEARRRSGNGTGNVTQMHY